MMERMPYGAYVLLYSPTDAARASIDSSMKRADQRGHSRLCSSTKMRIVEGVQENPTGATR
eukprot:6175899-Pleurochrysis_carterae.AAC.1